MHKTNEVEPTLVTDLDFGNLVIHKESELKVS